MDYRNKSTNGKNTILYGHSILTGSIFGTLKNVSIYFEKRNVFFKNGENSIYRLHLQKRGLWVLINNGITELSDLEGYSLDDVAEVLGFGWERAGYISKQMDRWGYKLKWV